MRISRTRWLALTGAAVLATTTVFAASNAYAEPGGTITGHLLDNGVPVPGVQVQALAVDGSVWLEAVETADDGAFTITGVPANNYRVSYSLPGTFTFYANSAIQWEDAAVIAVADGATITLNESVPAHGAISGRLSRSDGSGVSAFVQAWGPIGSFFANTNANGEYTLPYVWVGSYRVQFNPQSAPVQYAYQTIDFNDAQIFNVTAGATTTVDDTLVSVGTIAGRITNSDGTPASFARVEVLDSTSSFDIPVGSAFTGFDGTYTVGVVPGTYKVKVRFPSGISQYAHQKTSLVDADTFTVAEGETVIVDEESLAPGSIGGTLTNPDGTPATGTFVSVQSQNDFYGGVVGPTGIWSVQVAPGTYTVSFNTQLGSQWATGKTSAVTADTFTVGSGATVEVNDALLAPGSVTVTASDRKTGAALTNFCVSHSFGGACTDTGSVTFSLRAGEHWLFVGTDDQSYIGEQVIVNLASGQDLALAVPLTKAATITTMIKDAVTGAPISGACLHLAKPLDPTTLRSFGECSGPDGTLVMRGIAPGVYNAFVSVHDGEHGMQWVGWFRGTGAQAKARLIPLGEGATVALPAVKLDKAGTVTGTISDQATGDPLEFAFLGVASFNSGLGETGPGVSTDGSGQYTFDDLGPYEWTFFIRKFGHASMFTGGSGDRFLAQGVKVTARQTTTYDVSMRQGTRLTGVVTNADGSPLANFVRVTLISALSGDELDIMDITGSQPYELRVASPLLVKLKMVGPTSNSWIGGEDFLHARVFLVGTGETQVLNVSLNP
jgi:hypothetical protein